MSKIPEPGIIEYILLIFGVIVLVISIGLLFFHTTFNGV